MGRKKSNSSNHTARIGDEFNKELDRIAEARIEIGRDKNKRSVRELTNLVTKHDFWGSIREDLIALEIEKDEE